MIGSAETGRLPLRLADFNTLIEALDYAAAGENGLVFNKPGGEVTRNLPYRELREEAIALAGQLAAVFEPKSHIGLVAETSADFVTAFMACQYAGLIPAPISLPPAIGGRAQYQTQVRSMWSAASLDAILSPARFKSFYTEAFGEDEAVILPMEADSWKGRPVAGLRPLGAEDLCYIQFSSGSTSDPKGIVATQSSVAANCRLITRHGLQVREGDRAVSWLPLYHDMGLVGFFIAPLMSQLSVDYLATSDFARRPISWLKLISDNKATLSYSPSFGYELCARRYRGEDIDLSSWRAAGIGGDMVRHGVLTDFAECFAGAGFSTSAFVASYGLAEATLAVSFAPLGEGFKSDSVDAIALRFEDQVRSAGKDADPAKIRRFVYCGKPMPDHEVRIRAAAPDNLADRVIGRIQVRGPSIALGYYRGTSGIEPIADHEGWLDTGDLGYWLNGEIIITGRLKDLIIWNGRNIWPQDVEWVVQEVGRGLVSRCVVIDIDEGKKADRIVLLAECRNRDEEVRETLRRDIAQAARQATGAPVEVVLVAPRSLPVTSSGKLSRSAARIKLLEDAFESMHQPA